MENNDGLRPARGCFHGCLLSIIFWVLIAVAVWGIAQC